MADEDGLCLLVSPNGVRGVGEEDSRVEFTVRSRGEGRGGESLFIQYII